MDKRFEQTFHQEDTGVAKKFRTSLVIRKCTLKPRPDTTTPMRMATVKMSDPGRAGEDAEDGELRALRVGTEAGAVVGGSGHTTQSLRS